MSSSVYLDASILNPDYVFNKYDYLELIEEY